MKSKVSKKYLILRNILAFLNILIGILILITAYHLIETEPGKGLLALGYLLLTISTVLKVAQRW